MCMLDIEEPRRMIDTSDFTLVNTLSKLNTHRAFIEALHEEWRNRAKMWGLRKI